MSHATTINNYFIHLYCLALWLRRLGAGLEDRAEGSTTWRSVFCLLAPKASCGAEMAAVGAGPRRADVEAVAGRIARGDFHGVRTHAADWSPRAARAIATALPAPPHHLARKNQISWRRPYPFKPNGSQSSRRFHFVTLCLQAARADAPIDLELLNV